jgi:hypothetical protein
MFHNALKAQTLHGKLPQIVMRICFNRIKEKEKHLISFSDRSCGKIERSERVSWLTFPSSCEPSSIWFKQEEEQGGQVSRPAILCWKLIYPHIEFFHNSFPTGQQETMFCGSPVTEKPGGFHMKESRTIPTTIHDLNAFQSSLFVLELHHDHTLRVILIHLQTNNLPISGTSFTERLV